ncbi:GGDEF domain-containing protein [Vibrio sp.]|uniref:GGDEF domain-containing protein n=1 Tax=Vibrio sp. TaxID=678 RepID=UPI003D0EA397
MRLSRIVIFLLIATILITSSIVAYYSQRYQQVTQKSLLNTAQQAIIQLNYNAREYNNIEDQLFSVINLLSHGQATHHYALSEGKLNQSSLEAIFISVAENQKWYNSIFFLNNSGGVSLKVDYSSVTQRATPVAEPFIYPQPDLLLYANQLSKEQVGIWVVSGDNSNIPSLQLITPIIIQNQRYGYVVVDVDLWRLSYRLNYSLEEDLHPQIVTEKGIYLTQKLAHHSLMKPGVIFDQLVSQFPDTWHAMRTENSGYRVENGHLIVFHQVALSDQRKFYLVIDLTPNQLSQRAARDLNDLVKEGIFVFLLVLIFVLPTISMLLHYHRRNMESKLARAALSGTSAVMISDRSHQVMAVNDEFERITGLPRSWALGRNALKVLLSHHGLQFVMEVLETVTSDYLWEGEVEFTSPQGQMLTTIIRIQAILEGGKVSYYITSIIDISERKALENKLRELSEKDGLTHIWNRRKFEQELRIQSQLIGRDDGHHTCLALLDIDFFKRINDEQGHDQGDRVIKGIAHQMLIQLRTSDFIARIGGEEFAVIMPHTQLEDGYLIIEELRKSIASQESFSVSISAGVTDLSKDITRSYKCADIALYEAKTSGRNQVAICRSNDDIA